MAPLPGCLSNHVPCPRAPASAGFGGNPGLELSGAVVLLLICKGMAVAQTGSREKLKVAFFGFEMINTSLQPTSDAENQRLVMVGDTLTQMLTGSGSNALGLPILARSSPTTSTFDDWNRPRDPWPPRGGISRRVGTCGRSAMAIGPDDVIMRLNYQFGR